MDASEVRAIIESMRPKPMGHVHAAREVTRFLRQQFGDQAYYVLVELQDRAAVDGDPFVRGVCRVAENFMVAQTPSQHWPKKTT